MTKFNWNNKKFTSIKDETTQRQHDPAAEWLYCRDQESNKKKNDSAYLDSGIIHGSIRRESQQHRQKRERRLQQQKQRYEAEMAEYEEERRRFDMVQQRNKK